jgi:hypothetical protein
MLETDAESTEDLLRAGQALERMLLVAAERAFKASFLHRPCQVLSCAPIDACADR